MSACWSKRGWVLALLAVVASPAAFCAAAPKGMVLIPGGATWIGADQGRADERPRFLATVPGFFMDRTPVTVAAFAQFVAKTRYRTTAETLGSGGVMTFGTGKWHLLPGAYWRKPWGPQGPQAGETHPVTQVSYTDASAYCAAQDKRLPSEIEWEHAARSGSKGVAIHAFGDALQDAQGRYRANVWTGVFPMLNTAADGFAGTSPVAAFGLGPQGLADMGGNVWQWTSDWYRPYGAVAQSFIPNASSEKVQRGGSFLCDPKVCYGFRVTARGHATPESAHMHVGFRCAK